MGECLLLETENQLCGDMVAPESLLEIHFLGVRLKRNTSSPISTIVVLKKPHSSFRMCQNQESPSLSQAVAY